MKYTGRIVIATVVLVLILVIRTYGILNYNYPPLKLPVLGVIIVFIFWWLGEQYDKVKFLSEKDVLTKIYNRRFIIQTFPKLLASVDRKKEKLSLFLIDVDNFKMINDTYGHEIGDKVLQHISSALLTNIRKNEIVARWAGDEFLIISPFTDEKEIHIISSRIKNELKKSSEEMNIAISVSIGASMYPNDAKTLDDLFNIADQNMYKLKSQKKNNLKNNFI